MLWDEKKRERDLHRVGLGTSRVFFEDYWGDRKAAALRRMREEYDETAARFGTSLPDNCVREARRAARRGRRLISAARTDPM